MSECPAPAEAGDKLQAAVSRAARAQALLENELLRDAFEKLEDDYVAAWKTWPAADTAGRERLWRNIPVPFAFLQVSLSSHEEPHAAGPSCSCYCHPSRLRGGGGHRIATYPHPVRRFSTTE